MSEQANAIAKKAELQLEFEKVEKSFKLQGIRTLEQILSTGEAKKSEGFDDKYHFAHWWMEQISKQSGACHYCEVQFADIKELIDAKFLRERKTGYGYRGIPPEIDRLDSIAAKNVYSPSNCVLACYYCNNDKSNIYPAKLFKKYLGPARKALVEGLLLELRTENKAA
ncbi:hypothetical protein GW915_08340 [bacterium]|nr:hypothetical protein [bacterium]